MAILRMLSTLGGLAVVACLSLAGAAHAQGASYAQAQAQYQGQYQIPPGSYRQTCQNIRIEGSILRATCTNIAGQRVAASIDLSVCRNRELNNNNGALFCAAPYTPAPQPQPQRPPVGSYQDSCRDEMMRGSILTARCTTRTGSVVNASIDVSTCGNREIYNDNGMLRCAGVVPPQSPMPGGTWQNSCRDPSLRGDLLTARCTRPGAQPVTSTLDLSTCRTREAVNDNGYLRCAYPGQQAQIPEGSYRSTCRDISVRGNVLTARCTREDRSSNVSSLDLAGCRNRDIYNANGVLRCGAPTGSQLPEGSYQATCRDAALRGNILTARCTRGNQPTVVSSLDVTTCRGRDIANVGGYLQCGGFGRGEGRGGGRGRGGQDEFEAVLYTGTNYRGQQILVTEPIAALSSQSGFNDAVRSIRVLRGSVEVCQDPNFGRCVTIDESTPDLSALRMDRVISSVRGADDGYPGRGRGRGFD